jgi:TetR/AcrR family transcriptional regulator, regulator of cefoperazone and chloramphenicol sensitivity
MSPRSAKAPPDAASEPKPLSGAGTPTRRRRTPSGREDPGTRQKVIEAAIQCILEQGFYRASSNAIAERAGLSWGVIQYYFGSRESLMLAVLEEGTSRLLDDLSKANITGQSTTERLEEYFRILESYYGEPEYLAFVQVLLNLSHDPRTSAQARDAMLRNTTAIDSELSRLTNQLFAGTGIRSRSLRTFAFHVLRGLALSEVMLTTLPFDTQTMVRNVSDQRRLLARAVSLLIESESPTAQNRKR